jgi:signal transduction histidine kinase
MDKEALLAQISKTSHDLRNALSVLYSYTQLLELTLGKPETAEEQKTASELSASVKDMEALLQTHVDELKKIASN